MIREPVHAKDLDDAIETVEIHQQEYGDLDVALGILREIKSAHARLAEQPSAVVCRHPSIYVYVLINEPATLLKSERVVRWCRNCGSLHGWKPADSTVKINGWQHPDHKLGEP